MIEKVYEISGGNERVVEMLIEDEFIHFIHMVFHRNEGLPKHTTGSNIYLAVTQGTLSITLGRQKTHEYVSGCFLKIPCCTNMKIENRYEDTLELFMLKVPAPVKG